MKLEMFLKVLEGSIGFNQDCNGLSVYGYECEFQMMFMVLSVSEEFGMFLIFLV